MLNISQLQTNALTVSDLYSKVSIPDASLHYLFVFTDFYNRSTPVVLEDKSLFTDRYSIFYFTDGSDGTIRASGEYNIYESPIDSSVLDTSIMNLLENGQYTFFGDTYNDVYYEPSVNYSHDVVYDPSYPYAGYDVIFSPAFSSGTGPVTTLIPHNDLTDRDRQDNHPWALPEASLGSQFYWDAGKLQVSDVSGVTPEVTKEYIDGSLAARDLSINELYSIEEAQDPSISDLYSEIENLPQDGSVSYLYDYTLDLSTRLDNFSPDQDPSISNLYETKQDLIADGTYLLESSLGSGFVWNGGSLDVSLYIPVDIQDPSIVQIFEEIENLPQDASIADLYQEIENLPQDASIADLYQEIADLPQDASIPYLFTYTLDLSTRLDNFDPAQDGSIVDLYNIKENKTDVDSSLADIYTYIGNLPQDGSISDLYEEIADLPQDSSIVDLYDVKENKADTDSSLGDLYSYIDGSLSDKVDKTTYAGTASAWINNGGSFVDVYTVDGNLGGGVLVTPSEIAVLFSDSWYQTFGFRPDKAVSYYPIEYEDVDEDWTSDAALVTKGYGNANYDQAPAIASLSDWNIAEDASIDELRNKDISQDASIVLKADKTYVDASLDKKLDGQRIDVGGLRSWITDVSMLTYGAHWALRFNDTSTAGGSGSSFTFSSSPNSSPSRIKFQLYDTSSAVASRVLYTNKDTYVDANFVPNASIGDGLVWNAGMLDVSVASSGGVSQQYVDGSLATKVNKTDLDTSLGLYVKKAGDTMTGALAMSNQKITGIGDATLKTDALTMAKADKIYAGHGELITDLNAVDTFQGYAKMNYKRFAVTAANRPPEGFMSNANGVLTMSMFNKDTSYGHQIAYAANENTVWHRRIYNNIWGDWRHFADWEDVSTSFARITTVDSTYVKKAGDTMTGDLIITGADIISATGSFSTVFGQEVGGKGGSYNTLVGRRITMNITDTSVISNTLIGDRVLYGSAFSAYNVGVGGFAGYSLISSSDNVLLGHNAGRYYGTGTGINTGMHASILLGQAARTLANNAENEIVIGYNAVGNGSNTVTLGNTNITAGYLGGKEIATKDTSILTKSTNYTVVAADNNDVLEIDASITVTLPDNVNTGFQLTIVNAGTGYVTIDASTIRSVGGAKILKDQYAGASAVHKGAGVWYVWGNLE